MAVLTLCGRVEDVAAADAQLFFNRPSWEADFMLQPWRINGGPIDPRTLRVILGNLDRDTANGFFDSCPSGAVVQFRIAQLPDPQSADPELFAIGFDGEVADAELRDFVISAPVFPPYQHSRFGTFTRQHPHAPYAVPVRWAAHEISLRLDGDFSQLPQAAGHAEAMMDQALRWQADVTDCMHRDLYPLWNDVWRDDQPVMGRDAWLARVRPTSLTVDGEGQFTVYFDDGDLFWGHAIEVSGSIAGGADRAGIVG